MALTGAHSLSSKLNRKAEKKGKGKLTWKRPRFLEDGALTLIFTGRTFPVEEKQFDPEPLHLKSVCFTDTVV